MLLVILKLQQSVCLYFQRFGLLSKMQMWSHRGFGDVLIICDCPYNCRGVCLCVCECAVHQASANLILIVNRNELFGKDARRQIIKVNQTTNHTKNPKKCPIACSPNAHYLVIFEYKLYGVHTL